MEETLGSPGLQSKELREQQRQEREKERAEKRLKKEQARALKEALKHERELKKEQAEAEKEEKRREREAKRQLEEGEKERKRQEKEALERKKNAALQRQANILGKFLKREQPSPSKKTESTEETSQSSQNWALLMDNELAQSSSVEIDELWRQHMSSWKSKRKVPELVYWGSRRTPKTQVIKELKVREESKADDASVSQEANPSSTKRPRMKLLQFHKCFRPAFYGTFSKKSNAIGPRHPLRKDLSLDYEVDSDDEWEEEAPGESLSDVDESDEEEKQEADAENEDGFVVPDGYLSENEGIDVERAPMSTDELATSNSQNPLSSLKSVTERALKSNRPYIIRNFRTTPTDLEGDAAVLRELCLQALSAQIVADELILEPPAAEDFNQEPGPSRTGTKRGRRSGGSLDDSVVPEIVHVLQATPQGMKKTVELLSDKLPGVPKSQIELKIREVADFKDNGWKVKEEMLAVCQPQKKVAVSEESTLPTVPSKLLCNFFQKRCLEGEMEEVELVHY